MKMLTVVFLSCLTLFGQTSPRLVRAMGEGSVTVAPDQVKISIGVVTQAVTAQEAATQNASLSTTVQAALQKALGNAGSIATSGYNITPNYRYPTGGPAQLTGYTVTNTVDVTTGTISLAGPLVDTATQAGANSIGALRFGLKDDSIPRAQALTAATQQARSHAQAMAAGLNVRIGNPVTVVEGSVGSPIRVSPIAGAAGGAASTPVEAGPMTVTASVTVDFELNPM
jgi:uncharacterized protein